jgi:pimeloyl-ACP methyl ester carboxylesterase
MTAGLLYVTMQPHDSLDLNQFHDWYNNEHGPMRLRFPFFQNGFRYRANDLANQGGKGSPAKPEWLAWYDVPDMQTMITQPYIGLRQPPVQSQRERDTMKQIKVDRKFFDFVYEAKADGFKVLENVENEREPNVLVAVSQDLYEGKEEEYERWYKEEHIPMLAKVPGWRRSRMFVTSSVEDKDKSQFEYVALHEYAPENGLDGPEFQAAVSTPWRNEVQKSVVKEKRRRTYDLVYKIGPAPRELRHIYAPIVSTDGKTREYPASESSTAAIESYITAPDGVELPYRLEGNADPQAPLIVLANCILADYHIWDAFVVAFLKANPQYRIVRYLKRGRFSACGDQPITVDVLAKDIVAILDALRVPKAAAVIGVSLGGCTALNVALNFPDRVSKVVSCDTSAKSPAGNSKAWSERVALSESEGAKNPEGEAIVGQELAEITTRRWFVAENYDVPELAERFEKVKQSVASNSLEGFRKSVKALWEYDMTAQLASTTTDTAFFVGAKDGVLPPSMKKLAESYGKGAHFVEIENAGHLPMVEQPQKFAEEVEKFLRA